MRSGGNGVGMGFTRGEQSRRAEDIKTKCFVLHRQYAVCSPG